MTIPERVCVGAVIGAFGINGEIRIKSFCSDPKSIADYDQLTDETGEKTFNLKIIGPIKGGFSARVSGVRYRDQAENLKGIALYVQRNEMPNLADDEFYYSDMVSKQFNTNHYKYNLNQDHLMECLDDVIREMPEPMFSQDSSAFYLLAQEVSKNQKVVLSGQGADELFGGYFWYKKMNEMKGSDSE